MALVNLSIDLREMEFPFLSQQKGNGAFFQDNQVVGERPRVSWINNLWPISQGKWAAVTREISGTPMLPPEAVLNFYTDGVRCYTALVQNARSYLLIAPDSWWSYNGVTWVEIYSPTSVGYPAVFSLKAKTYLVSATEGIFAFDESDPAGLFNSIDAVVLTGITAANIFSGCAALSYMILADEDTIYWSSPLNPTYFAPGGSGADYGAGSTKVLGIQSPITFVTGTEDGFYIFTEATVIQATYSGDPDNPWIFQTVENSSGALNVNYIVQQETLRTNFYWSESGLALLSQGSAQYVASEVTELLAGDILEVYESAFRRPVISQTGVVFDLQLNFISNRYLVISYGLTGIVKSFILVFDTVLNMWFRLNIEHLAVLEVIAPYNVGGLIFENWEQSFWDTGQSFASMFDSVTNKQTNTMAIGVLQADGSIARLTPIRIAVDNNSQEVLSNQVVIEDVRLTRSSRTELHEVTIVHSYPTFAGATGTPNTNFVGPGTQVFVQDTSQGVPIPYALGYANEREQRWVNRVQGERLTVTLENIGSFSGLNLGMRQAGRRLR